MRSTGNRHQTWVDLYECGSQDSNSLFITCQMQKEDPVVTRVWIVAVAVLAVAGVAWLLVDFPTVDTQSTVAEAPEALTPLAERPGRTITAPEVIVKARNQAQKKAAGAEVLVSGAPARAQEKSQPAPADRQPEFPSIYLADGPSQIRLSEVPKLAGIAATDYTRGGARIESKMSEEEILAAQTRALRQRKSKNIQNIDSLGRSSSSNGASSRRPLGQKPQLGAHFNAIDAANCCQNTGFSAQVPPDPDLAVGPDHVIAVVNTTFEVYDKQGNSLTGPIQFASFFDPTLGGTNPGGGIPTEGCNAYDDIFGIGVQFATVFDPDAVYDAANDRFVIGIDANGEDFCVAASQTGDPTGVWNRYGFDTDVDGAFFDFPHMGVGNDAIFMGSNQFGGTLPFGFQGRVFAMDKMAMYDGNPLTVVTRELAPPGLEGPANVKLDGTPQPAQVATGPDDPHYIMSEFFDGPTHSVYSWDDPFGANVWNLEGDVDLADASGVPCDNQSCFPIPWPQKGSPEILAGNDFRGQETKVGPDGTLWTTQHISCNPGKGTRMCVRWAQIDPTAVEPAPDQTAFPLNASTDGVVQAGVFGSDWGWRTFPSIATNSCGDMFVGYSYSASPGNAGGTEYPSIFVTGRKADDPLGQVNGERRLKKGDGPYVSFQDNGGQASVRWGDYTGMQPDPDGKRVWYIGEYTQGANAVNSAGTITANWGTYIGSFTMPGCE